MVAPLIPIIMLGAGTAARVVSKVAPQVAKRLIQAGKAKRASPAEVKVLSSTEKATSATSKAAPKMGPKVKETSTSKNKPTEDSVASEFLKKEQARVAPKSTVNKINKKIEAKNRQDAKKKAADEAAKREMTSTSGAGRAAGSAGITALTTAAALSDKDKDTEKPKKEDMPTQEVKSAPKVREAVPLEISESRPSRKPAPVEEGKPGMTRAEAEEKGIAKPEGGFWQGVADALAGGKGKGTVEYEYPSDDKEKKRGGMVYRMKGGKVGKATKRGTGKAMTGAYISYGKPMKEKMSSGGKVGMRGCGKAMRGYGKAMKGK